MNEVNGVSPETSNNLFQLYKDTKRTLDTAREYISELEGTINDMRETLSLQDRLIDELRKKNELLEEKSSLLESIHEKQNAILQSMGFTLPSKDKKDKEE